MLQPGETTARQTSQPLAGEVWYVDFDPQRGREQAGVRPALVISTNEFNHVRNDLIIVCPLTTRDRGLRYHIPVDPISGVLTRRSLVMCEQVKAQDVGRFLSRRGSVPAAILRSVRTMVADFIDGPTLYTPGSS